MCNVQDLVEMVLHLQETLDIGGRRIADMEDYTDNLLVKIMERMPVILERRNSTDKANKMMNKLKQ